MIRACIRDSAVKTSVCGVVVVSMSFLHKTTKGDPELGPAIPMSCLRRACDMCNHTHTHIDAGSVYRVMLIAASSSV